MSDCEFIKLCEEAFGATVPGCKDDHWRGCPNYDLCVRVHNQAIEKVMREAQLNNAQMELMRLFKKPPSQEGE